MIYSSEQGHHHTKKKLNNQNKQRTRAEHSIFLILWSRKLACLYKNFSLELTFLMIPRAILSPFKYWSMVRPKYLKEGVAWIFLSITLDSEYNLPSSSICVLYQKEWVLFCPCEGIAIYQMNLNIDLSICHLKESWASCLLDFYLFCWFIFRN